jgi:hypothetical protein
MVAEEAQELGRDGVLAVKQWLESTTHVNFDFMVYDNQAKCTLENLSAKPKRFDLEGRFLEKKARALSVESKHYKTVGGQAAGFQEFLAIAYSTTARELETIGDTRREYMWVTYHPFAQTLWPKLTKKGNIRKALENYPRFLGQAPNEPEGTYRDVNEDVVDLLADRLWVLVFSHKQEKLMLSPKELSKVFAQLKRKP